MKEIILASASKRRSRILSDCGIKHRVVISDAEEIMDKSMNVPDIVKANADLKAEKVKKAYSLSVIIAADTLVAHGDRIIGKPSDEDEARHILESFSGGKVDVFTGICGVDTETGNKALDADKSGIYVDPIDRDKLDRLFDLLGPYDKAGGFSIEGVGSMLFDNIEGSYFNILGLSMMKLKRMFAEVGLDILDFIDSNRDI